MELFFEIFFQFAGELVLQLVAEVLVELGMHSLADTTRKPRHPVLSMIGFALWGVIFGGLSLLILPSSPIHNPDLRLINLLVSPALAGLAMVAIGNFRQSKGQQTTRINRFGFAFSFAFAFATTRFAFVG